MKRTKKDNKEVMDEVEPFIYRFIGENMLRESFRSEMVKIWMPKERVIEERGRELDSSLEFDILKRLDHVILIMEDYLNSNREIVNKLEMVGGDSTNQIEVKNKNIIESLDHFTSVMGNYLDLNTEIVKRLDPITDKNTKQKEISEEDLIELQDLSEDTIEKIIHDYIEKNLGKEIYPSDIAIAFNLDGKIVFDISERMKKEGKLV